MDQTLRDPAEQEQRLCVCGHPYDQHIPKTGTCVGGAQFMSPGQQWLTACGCKGFQLNAFTVRPDSANANNLLQITFNGRDISDLLRGKVRDHDEEFHAWQLRLSLDPDAEQRAPEVVRDLWRIAGGSRPTSR